MIDRIATRKDVALRAGVSETIVSYVLNNNRYVAQDKRERVLKAVQELHYRPNRNARAMKGKGNNHILFIVDQVFDEHFGRLVQGMDAIAYDRGYLISLMAIRNTEEFVAQVISRHVDGIIISSFSFQEKYVQILVDSGIPVVLIVNRIYQHMDARVGKVFPGMMDGMREAVQLLIDKGRQHIVYIDRISSSGNFSDMQDLRYRGFCAQMESSGLPFSKDSIFTGCSCEAELHQAIMQRIQSGAVIDGIMARNDNMACVALSAVLDCGLSVPKDVSIIGFDNSRVSSIITPHLTTVEINRPAMAQAIIDIFDDMFSGKEPTEKHFSTTLILRDSV